MIFIVSVPPDEKELGDQNKASLVKLAKRIPLFTENPGFMNTTIYTFQESGKSGYEAMEILRDSIYDKASAGCVFIKDDHFSMPQLFKDIITRDKQLNTIIVIDHTRINKLVDMIVMFGDCKLSLSNILHQKLNPLDIFCFDPSKSYAPSIFLRNCEKLDVFLDADFVKNLWRRNVVKAIAALYLHEDMGDRQFLVGLSEVLSEFTGVRASVE